MESWGGGICLVLWMHFAENRVWDLGHGGCLKTSVCLARKGAKDGKYRRGRTGEPGGISTFILPVTSHIC